MRRAAIPLVLIVCLAGPTASSRAETAKEVIQKAVDAMGGAETNKKYPAARATNKGKISVMGLEIELEGEAAYMLPDKAKTTMKMEVLGQKVNVVQIVNGEKTKITANDMATPISDAQKQELKLSMALQAVQNLAPLLEGKTYE